ncbi:hypothetical protein [Methylomonas koyamae]|uniref:hypothetical protein n=1 Tax=Methylomonas koyamae TaxID=702114 RepID=UPI001C900F5B
MVSIPSRASGLRIAVDSIPAQRRSEPAAALLCQAVELQLWPYRSGATLDRHYSPNGKGQLTHVLRHTFASHFMMNGGNILTLQKILGNGSLKLNPLSKMGR